MLIPPIVLAVVLAAAAPAGGAHWPSAETTGVPRGAALERVNRDLDITRPGTVVRGKDVRGCVTIAANDVTIARTRIRCRSWYGIRTLDGAHDVVLEDVDVSCEGFVGIGVAGVGYTARRVHVHRCGDGLRLDGDVVVEDSLVDRLVAREGSHNDAVQTTGGRNIVLRHNTLLNRHPQTSAIILGAELGPTARVRISRNLLAGGGWTLYCGAPEVTGVRVTGNRFSTRYFRRAGSYGPAADCSGVARWRDNRMLESGRPVRR